MIASLERILPLVLFCLALVHVFLAPRFERLAMRYPAHAGVLHLLGEVEVVFGFWAAILFLSDMSFGGTNAAIAHLESLNFNEPLFVFVVMVVAGSRPILQAASAMVEWLALRLPFSGAIPFSLVTLFLSPLLGSLITEPAAMTVAALLLRKRLFVSDTSQSLRYGALGVLFVNISIGGVLTSYAAPPVLMVARTWDWDTSFMMATFGWRAIIAVAINAILFTIVFRKELSRLVPDVPERADHVPGALVIAHIGTLALIVLASHHIVVFVGLFLFFLGMVQAFKQYSSRLLLREGLLVGFFLAGLVVLGNPQSWWLQPIVSGLGDKSLFIGAAGLTAVIDNAALTYLGSLLPDTTESFRYHLLAGAVVGGGLTLIANAPNPAGASILRDRFSGGVIRPGKLLMAASIPTMVALVVFGFR